MVASSRERSSLSGSRDEVKKKKELIETPPRQERPRA